MMPIRVIAWKGPCPHNYTALTKNPYKYNYREIERGETTRFETTFYKTKTQKYTTKRMPPKNTESSSENWLQLAKNVPVGWFAQ